MSHFRFLQPWVIAVPFSFSSALVQETIVIVEAMFQHAGRRLVGVHQLQC